MDLPLFDQVNDLLRALAPADLGDLHSRAHRRGVKVWFNAKEPPREHYEAQVFSRRLIDGTDGTALEIGFHSEHNDSATNTVTLERLLEAEPSWRKQRGANSWERRPRLAHSLVLRTGAAFRSSG